LSIEFNIQAGKGFSILNVLKNNTIYFTYFPTKTRFQPYFVDLFAFIAESRKYHPVVVPLHNDKWLNKISTKFRQVLIKQCSVFYRRSRVLRYFVKINMAPLQCLVNETLVVLETNKAPITHLGSQLKTNNSKVTRNLREKSSGLLAGGGGWDGVEYFHETFVRHHSKSTKNIIFIAFL
jgi:hypothetical protein